MAACIEQPTIEEQGEARFTPLPFLTHLCDHSMTAMNKNGKSAEMIIPSKLMSNLLSIPYKFRRK